MKKQVIFSAVLLVTCMATGFSQLNTSSPDQSSNTVSSNMVVTPVATNDMTASNTAASTNAPDTNAAVSNAAVTPETEITATNGLIYNDGKYNYAGPGVKFVVSARDDLSGVKQINIKLDDSDFGVYNNPFGFITEGKHVVLFNAMDNVWNASPEKIYEFIADLTPPEVSLSSDKKPVKIGDSIYIGTNYNFSIRAFDSLSGVKSVSYTIDTNQTNSYSNSFNVPGSNGLHTISYNAMDNVGNLSETKVYSFNLDTTPPAVVFEVHPDIYSNNGTNYISGSSCIRIKATDSESGVAVIQVSIDGADYSAYINPITLSSGSHDIKAKAMDNVGNTSDPIDLQVTVDNAYPTTELNPTK